MKLAFISICVAKLLSSFVEAAPTAPDPQQAASRQIEKWQRQYNEQILKTVKERKSGCTAEKLIYRKEWSVS